MKLIAPGLFLLFGLFFSGTNLVAAPSYPPQVGTVHPDFVLPQIDSRDPVTIQFPLSGSEIAQPMRRFLTDSEKASSPDPDGLLDRDTTGLIEVEAAVVPSRIRSGKSTRVHINFLPAESLQAHWNNEAEPLRVWVDLPEGWGTENPLLSAPQPEEIESVEMRHIDFGILTPAGLDPGTVPITAYALYYVCEGKNGTCQFLRKDIKIHIEIVK